MNFVIYARKSTGEEHRQLLSIEAQLRALKFPTFWFESTPQGKFMLNIAFGHSRAEFFRFSTLFGSSLARPAGIRRLFPGSLRFSGVWCLVFSLCEPGKKGPLYDASNPSPSDFGRCDGRSPLSSLLASARGVDAAEKEVHPCGLDAVGEICPRAHPDDGTDAVRRDRD